MQFRSHTFSCKLSSLAITMKPISPSFLLLPLLIIILFSADTLSYPSKHSLSTQSSLSSLSPSPSPVFTEAFSKDTLSYNPSKHSLSSPTSLSTFSPSPSQAGLTEANGRAPVVYTTYILNIQYPKNLCAHAFENKRCDINYKTDLPNAFTIHGLWPDGAVGRGPKPPVSQFEVDQIHNDIRLRDGLYEHWIDAYFNYKGGPNKETSKHIAAESFWFEEWKKHGTYSGLNTHDYFRLALDLFLKLGDVIGHFEARHYIQPKAGGGFAINVTEAYIALKEVLGVDTFLKCKQNAIMKDEFVEIEILYDKFTLQRLHRKVWFGNVDYHHNCQNEIVDLDIDTNL